MTLYRIDPDWTKSTAWAADTLAGLRDLGVLVPVVIDYEAALETWKSGGYMEEILESALGKEYNR